ncbi:MAG: hypothetical protein EBR82_86815 [Caulobacteraceae bacterium]|nr:hypothetical protein [Caulobacteraceae bacterium]
MVLGRVLMQSIFYPAIDAFLHRLDFEYDRGYGTQELFGTIWYTDGTWSGRYEYDGAEEWVHRKIPVIPEYLKKVER